MGEVRSPRILMAVQQLRRTVPGGIGAYARGLLAGLAQAAEAGETIDITLYASRPPRRRSGGGADPLSRFGYPVVGSRLPGPIMTRAWDHGWLGPLSGFDIIHAVSLAAPPARARRGERAVVTVHDLSWRRYPEASTPRGRTWHEAALGQVLEDDLRRQELIRRGAARAAFFSWDRCGTGLAQLYGHVEAERGG